MTTRKGWVPVVVLGQRGLWVKTSHDAHRRDRIVSMEICAGHQGDDAYFSAYVNNRLTEMDFADLLRVFAELSAMFERANTEE